MSMKFLSVAVAAAALAAVPAAAATMNGTAGAAIAATSNTASIDVGSVLTPSFAIVLSNTGDLLGFAGTTLTTSAFTATNGSAFSFTSLKGGYSGNISNVLSAGAPESRMLTAFALGTFSPSGTFNGFAAGPASLTFTFSQNGSGAAIQGGFILSTPPVQIPGGAVPEPATWAMLIAGFGLTGAAMRRRRSVVAA